MPFILAIDQGTTSSRSILFRTTGILEASAQQEFPQYYPHPAWVEHEAGEIWQSQYQTIRDVLRQQNISHREIAAIGITNQRETTVIWDRRTGKPVHRAIVWQDRRTADLCAQLSQQGVENQIRRKTGLLLDPYFSATKIAWILDQDSSLRKRAEQGELAFGTVDSWLVWQLTKGKKHITDPSNASRTLLFNLQRMDWDEELLELFRIPRALLPQVVDTSGMLATCALEELDGVPICALAGDQQAALFGQACFQPGTAKNTYGTGCFLLWQSGSQPILSDNRLLTTVGWKIGNQVSYALEGSIFMGGAIVQWLRDGLGMIESSSDIEPLARSVESTQDLYLVPAFTGLGAPWWDPHARGLLIGLTRGTQRGHIARAALEAIAFQVHDVLQAMQKDTGRPLQELRVDGGASANHLLLQFQSDLLNVSVHRPWITETTAWGAASLAGLGIGIWSSLEEVEKLWQAGASFSPQMDTDVRNNHLVGWQEAVSRSRQWANHTPL